MNEFITVLFYVVLAIITSDLYKRAIKAENRNDKIRYFIIITLIILTLSFIAAFRGDTGTDSLMYKNLYESQNFIRKWDTLEKGYILVNQILYGLGLPYQALFFLFSFIQSFFVFKVIKHEQRMIDTKLAVFIYVLSMYFPSFNVMRQLAVVAICLYAILLYLDKRYVYSVLLILLSAQIHKTAYIVLAIVFARFVFEKRQKWLTVSSLAILLYLVVNRNILNELFFLFTGKYTGYLSEVMATDGNVLMHFMKLSPLIILAILHFNDYRIDKRYYTFFGLYLCGIILESLDYFSNTQVGRIGYYFSYSSIILFPYIAKFKTRLCRSLSAKNTKELIYIWYIVLFIYNCVIKNFGAVVPYFNL